MKKGKVEIFQGKLTAEESSAVAKRLAEKSEPLVMRLTPERKKEIRQHAAAAGSNMTDYMLIAEKYFAASMKLGKPAPVHVRHARGPHA